MPYHLRQTNKYLTTKRHHPIYHYPTTKQSRKSMQQSRRSMQQSRKSMQRSPVNPMFLGVYYTMKFLLPGRHITKTSFSIVFEKVKAEPNFYEILQKLSIPIDRQNEINTQLVNLVKLTFREPAAGGGRGEGRGAPDQQHLARLTEQNGTNEIAFGAAMVHIFMIACWSGGLRDSNIISLLLAIILFYFYILINQWDDRRDAYTSLPVLGAYQSVFAMLVASVYNCVTSMFRRRPNPILRIGPPSPTIPPSSKNTTLPDFFPRKQSAKFRAQSPPPQ